MVFEELFKGGPVFACGDLVFAPGTDAVVLADFADVKFSKNICDIGCGCGVLAVVSAIKNPGAAVTALDIQPEACRITMENIKENCLEGRINVICGDIREYKSLFVSGSFDHIISNPPYFPAGSGKSSAAFELARQEVKCSLYDIISAVSYMLKYGGYFSLVHRADRAAEVIWALSEAGLEPKIIRLVQHKPDSIPSLILIKCKKGGKKGVSFLPNLILANSDGTRSREILSIYEKRWEA